MSFIDPSAYGWREIQPECLPHLPAPQAALDHIHQIIDGVYGNALLTEQAELDSCPIVLDECSVRVVPLSESADGTDATIGGWYELVLFTSPEICFRFWSVLGRDHPTGADKYSPYVHQGISAEFSPITNAEAASILFALPADLEPILQNPTEQTIVRRMQRVARSIRSLLFGR